MVNEEAKEESEISLDLQEKEVESKPTLEVALLIIFDSHSYSLHCPNLRIDVT